MQEKQRRKRRGYTAAELAEQWDRWGPGESSKTIAQVMGRGASVYTVLLRCGGRAFDAIDLPGARSCNIDRQSGGWR